MAVRAKANPSVTDNTQLFAQVEIGTVAGLVGGGIFGVQMLLGGMYPMIASMVGSESVLLGFVLHMVISAIIGATFGAILSFVPFNNLTSLTGLGVVYGIVWWVLGALVIMPTVLGMGEMVLQVGEMQIASLIGHVIFGLTMGVLHYLLNK